MYTLDMEPRARLSDPESPAKRHSPDSGSYTHTVPNRDQPRVRRVAILRVPQTGGDAIPTVESDVIRYAPMRSRDMITDVILVGKHLSDSSWVPTDIFKDTITRATQSFAPNLYQYVYYYAGFDAIRDDKVAEIVLFQCEFREAIEDMYFLDDRNPNHILYSDRGVGTTEDAMDTDTVPPDEGHVWYPCLKTVCVYSYSLLPRTSRHTFWKVPLLQVECNTPSTYYRFLAGFTRLVSFTITVHSMRDRALVYIPGSQLEYLQLYATSYTSYVEPPSDAIEVSQRHLAHICTFRKLRELHLLGVTTITSIPAEIKDLVNLQVLSVWQASYLQRVDSNIRFCKSLRRVDLSQCRNLISIPEQLFDIESLEILDMTGCKALTAIPENFPGVTQIRVLQVSFCESLVRLPLGLIAVDTGFKFEIEGAYALTEPPWRSIFGSVAERVGIVQDFILGSARFKASNITWRDVQTFTNPPIPRTDTYFAGSLLLAALVCGLDRLQRTGEIEEAGYPDIALLLEELSLIDAYQTNTVPPPPSGP